MCSKPRIWTIVAGVFGLLQSLAWLGLAITALVLYHCELRPPELESSEASPRSLSTLIYFVYFYNPRCALPLNNSQTWWPTDPVPTAERTWQWAVAYVVLSATWVFCSIALLVNGAVWCRGVCARSVVPALWLVVTLGVIVADVVASIQYGLDIGQVKDSGSLLGLLKDVVEPGSDIENVLTQIPLSLSILPSLILLLATSRCFILWATNLILWLGVAFSLCCGQRRVKKPSVLHHSAPRHVEDPRDYHVPRVSQVQQDRSNTSKSHVTSPSATSTVPQHEFTWQGGPQQNMAFIGYDEAYDNDPGPIKYRRSYASDDGHLNNNNLGRTNSRLSAELRNQMPWSYLHPEEPRPLSGHHYPDSPRQRRSTASESSRMSPRTSRHNKRPTTPLAEEWEPTPSETSTIHLPRVPFHSSAPVLPHFQPQHYHFPHVHQQIYPRFSEVKDIYKP